MLTVRLQCRNPFTVPHWVYLPVNQFGLLLKVLLEPLQGRSGTALAKTFGQITQSGPVNPLNLLRLQSKISTKLVKVIYWAYSTFLCLLPLKRTFLLHYLNPSLVRWIQQHHRINITYEMTISLIQIFTFKVQFIQQKQRL